MKSITPSTVQAHNLFCLWLARKARKVHRHLKNEMPSKTDPQLATLNIDAVVLHAKILYTKRAHTDSLVGHQFL